MTNYEMDEERRRLKMARSIATQRMTEQSPQYDPPMRYMEHEDLVNHPPHYTFGKIEVLDAIEDWGLDYHSGNIVKYLTRAGRKTPDRLSDLKKAQFYLNRLVELEQK